MDGFAVFETGSQSLLVPALELRIEARPAPVLRSSVVAVRVSQFANEPASFSLEVDDPDFRLIDTVGGLLVEGKRVEIDMGYAGNVTPMIDGEVTAVSVDLAEDGGLMLRVEGFDHLYALTRGTRYREFRDSQTDSAIVKAIAADAGMDAQVDETGERSGRRVQQHVSDLDFVNDLARFNGYEVWADRKTLHFEKARLGARVTLIRGRSLVSFSARLSTAGQVSEVEVRGWDASLKKTVSHRATAGASSAYVNALAGTGTTQIRSYAASERVIHATGEVHSLDEARTRADAILAEQRHSLLTADGTAVGDPEIRPGAIMMLENMGRFSGEYLVGRATHEISQSGYRTTFEMSRDL